jgi:hypothetical protein
MVMREIVREGGGGSSTVTFPTLTKTNYQEWETPAMQRSGRSARHLARS